MESFWRRSDRIAFDDIHVRNGGGWVVRARRRGALGRLGKEGICKIKWLAYAAPIEGQLITSCID